MTRFRVPPQRTHEMYELYARGATLEEVGKRFGLSRQRVQQIFCEAGKRTRSMTETHTLRHERLEREQGEEICEAFLELRDIDAVAHKLNVPRVAIRKILENRLPGPIRQRRARVSTPKYPNEELIAFLKEAGASMEGQLTTALYTAYAKDRKTADGRPWPNQQTHVKRFGSWRKALREAGVNQHRDRH